MPLLKYSRLLTPFLLLICFYGMAQTPAEQKKQEQYAKLKSLIESRQYVFMAQSATSMKGRTVQLSTGYGLKLNKDSLHVDLPYYGRAYSTSYPANNDMGVKVNSHDFSYTADTTKKGGWNVNIKPKKIDVSYINLSISSGGYCTVRINSSNRDPITYYGTIKDLSGQ
jgi:hypothetical protein